MKIVVISDSHGNVANLKHVLGFAKEIKAGAIIHCGDWSNIEAVETVLNSGIDTCGVLGNADVDPKIEEILVEKSKKFTRTLLEFELDGKKIGVIHNIRDLDSQVPQQLDILFVGHRHKQEETVFNGVKVVNPGALEHGVSFAVYDTETNNIEFFEA